VNAVVVCFFAAGQYGWVVIGAFDADVGIGEWWVDDARRKVDLFWHSMFAVRVYGV